jgi:hypothetical protein
MLKKFLLILGLISLSYSLAIAGGVTDDNNGNAGDILVSTGENHGKDSVGVWTDSSFLKGDTGVAGQDGRDGINGQDGAQGRDGIDGLNGQDGSNGVDGLNGQDGYTPIKGVDYNDGTKGDTGDQGPAGNDGLNGSDGKDGINGVDGKDGKKGDKGDQGKRGKAGKTGDKGDVGSKGDTGDKGRQGDIGKGLKNRTELIGEVRVFDTRKWAGFVYGGHDFNNSVNVVGAKVQYKIGSSYEERQLLEIQERLNKIEMLQDVSSREVTSEFYTTSNNGIGIRNKF